MENFKNLEELITTVNFTGKENLFRHKFNLIFVCSLKFAFKEIGKR